jgi:hypothetical protein
MACSGEVISMAAAGCGSSTSVFVAPKWAADADGSGAGVRRGVGVRGPDASSLFNLSRRLIAGDSMGSTRLLTSGLVSFPFAEAPGFTSGAFSSFSWESFSSWGELACSKRFSASCVYSSW